MKVNADGTATLTSCGKSPTFWRQRNGPWCSVPKGESLILTDGDQVSLDCNVSAPRRVELRNPAPFAIGSNVCFQPFVLLSCRTLRAPCSPLRTRVERSRAVMLSRVLTTSTAVVMTNLLMVVVSSMEAMPISTAASADSKTTELSQGTVPRRILAASRATGATDRQQAWRARPVVAPYDTQGKALKGIARVLG